MDTPTHALIPVIVYGIARQKKLFSGTREEKIAVWRTAAIIAVVGCMPDALDPHETLAERLSSWSHSLLAWAGFSLLFVAICLFKRRWWSPMLALGLSLTYLSHIVGDAIAGGIGWSYPFGNDVIGDYYIAPKWWIPADFVCFVTAYVVYRVIPMIRAKQLRQAELEKKRAAVLAEAELPRNDK